MKKITLTDKSVTEKRGGLCVSYVIRADGVEVGECNLRLHDPLEPYGGNVGYRIEPEFRGHRHSLAALELLKAEAASMGLTRLLICCDPDNAASRRTAELSGAEALDIVEIPPECELYAYGRRRSCRYKIDLKG